MKTNEGCQHAESLYVLFWGVGGSTGGVWWRAGGGGCQGQDRRVRPGVGEADPHSYRNKTQEAVGRWEEGKWKVLVTAPGHKEVPSIMRRPKYGFHLGSRSRSAKGFLLFELCHMACRIFVSPPGIELMPSAVGSEEAL